MRGPRHRLSSKRKRNGYKIACEPSLTGMPLAKRRGRDQSVGGLTRSSSRESYSQALDVLTMTAVSALTSTAG